MPQCPIFVCMHTHKFTVIALLFLFDEKFARKMIVLLDEEKKVLRHIKEVLQIIRTTL